MADIRCSQCGKDNPDFLDVCQFCQTPLDHDTTFLHIGEEPTKKDTGELEEVLPDWLKDARKKGKNEEAADEAFRSQTKPKVPKEEPPDLLAGLMSQSDADEEDVPDWLASINPVADKKSPISKPSAKEELSDDFFAQFREAEQKPAAPAESEPAQDDVPAWASTEEQTDKQKEDLTDWFSQPAPEQSGTTSDEDSWMRNLAFSDSSEEKPPAEKEPEDLSWLHDLEASSKQPGDLSSPQSDAAFDFGSSTSDDDLGWLNNLGGTSAPSFEETAPSKPDQSGEDLDWLSNLGGAPISSSEKPETSKPASSDEDLSWLNNLGGTSTPASEEPKTIPPVSSDEDLSWLNNLGGTSTPASEEPKTIPPVSSDEDLSWLSNLGGTPASSSEDSETVRPSSSDEDLGWLKNLGGMSESAAEEPAPAQPASSEDDLSWLNALGGTSALESDEPAASQPVSSDDNLSWLNNLGGTPVPASEEPKTVQPAESDEDLGWLANLGGTTDVSAEEPAASQTSSSQEDLDWLKNLSETTESSAPAFSEEKTQEPEKPSGTPHKPFRTAPLKELVGDEPLDTTPDWLKSALEEPTMPAPGAVSMDWFSEHDKKADEEHGQTQGEPASAQPVFDFSAGDSSSASSQNVDDLFNVEMPDWLSREPESIETPQPETSEGVPADDTLSPVELPSWVQAMRPVDSSIDDSVASTVDQITEREGPLAGFRGVIPSSPIGSSLRPKAFSLKLHITEEQQASAALLEQIIAGETIAKLRKETAGVSSQNVLRWSLSALFLIVLGVVIGFGLQTMPIVPSGQLSNILGAVPESSPVLMVIDYEPSFTGELEASAGPLLDQLAMSKRSTFSFVSMSPNGSALVDRLILNTGVSGLGYQAGSEYFNLGFLPGGSTGVLGFIENPANEFSKYEAVVLLTDNAETGRVWIEQLDIAKGKDSLLAGKPFIVVASAQSAPMLQPYASAGQVNLMVNGLPDAAKFENMNNTRPGIARSYWDAFGIGLTMAIIAILLGSVWSVFMRIREQRAEAEQG